MFSMKPGPRPHGLLSGSTSLPGLEGEEDMGSRQGWGFQAGGTGGEARGWGVSRAWRWWGVGCGADPHTVCGSLRRHVSAINRLAQGNFFFWDYGNAFLLEAHRAGERGDGKGPGVWLVGPRPRWGSVSPGDTGWVSVPQEPTWGSPVPARWSSAIPHMSSILWGESRALPASGPEDPP